MSFEAFYHGPIHHPWQLWIAAWAATAYAVTRPGLDPGLRGFCALLGAVSTLDAWLTATTPYGIGALPGGAASAVPLVFVLLGDFRYLLLATAGRPDGRLRLGPRSVAAAAGLTLVVPVLSQTLTWALPGSPGPRTLFLVYELAFLSLAALLAARHPRVRGTPWLRDLSRFVMLYYGLWAAADAVLLATGSDLGFALRLVPNLLYYGGLIAAVAWLAPRPDPGAGPDALHPPSRRSP